jgi:beta-N-acetylhexosaminidase
MDANQLSWPQCCGQRLMVGFDGTRLNDQLKYDIEQIKVGGIILFARNLRAPGQIEALCADAHAHAQACGLPPLLIAMDQEGGVVARLKPPFTQFAGNPFMKSTDDAVAFAKTTARELRQIGVNMNMAPVLDVLPPQASSIMEKRAFGSDPHWVAEMGAAVIGGLQQNGIMAVAKHFPGIGRTTLDSHQDLPDLDIDRQSLAAVDLLPFQRAIDQGVSGVMLSHILYRQLDPKWPASLSTPIARDLLRSEMGYTGLVMTDDLDMGAVCKHFDIETMVGQCLDAAVDLILICHPGEKIQRAYKHIQKLTQKSARLAKTCEQSVQRIIDYKQKYLPE